MRPLIPPPVIAVFFAGIAFGFDVFSPFDLLLRGARYPASLSFIVAGLAVIGLGIAGFRHHKTTISPYAIDKANALVTSGIYRFTRNPMYLGMLLILLGIVAYTQDVLALLAPIGFLIALNRLQIRPEERALRRAFGPAYDAYCARTRRWL
jgi:protein-S-isoprenylcysteine O-methyltransferase Ste14